MITVGVGGKNSQKIITLYVNDPWELYAWSMLQVEFSLF